MEKGYTYKINVLVSNKRNDYKKLKMASNDCLDNYLLVCYHMISSFKILLKSQILKEKLRKK